MLQVGIAGIGFMGMIHFLAYRRVAGVRVAAICSRDQKKLGGDWRSIQGNFGPPGEQMDLSAVRTYQNFDAMLTDKELDLIDICLPPKMHRLTSVAALQAGKHVFCEKPMALQSADAVAMIRAAEAAKKQLLIGHIVPFFPEYAFALAAVRSGEYGKLLGGNFKRVIANPRQNAHYFDPDEVGGPLIDLLIHDAHFIRLLFGTPQAVFSRGRLHFTGSNGEKNLAQQTVEYVQTNFLYDDVAQVVTASGGVVDQQGRSFNQAFEIHFERTTLLYDFSVLAGKPHLAMPLTVLDNHGLVLHPKLHSTDPADGFVAEIQEVVDSIVRGQPSAILDSSLAADALELCHKQTESVLTNRLVNVR